MARSLLRNILTVGGWTLVSRGTGFARDVMMAAWLGTGPVAEAFLVAFSLPNMFRRFFAEGAFNMAFVPMFAKKLEGGEDAPAFARDAWNGMLWLLMAFTVVGTLAMPWLVWAMASGFRRRSALRPGRHLRPDQLQLYPLHLAGGPPVRRSDHAQGKFSEASFVPVLMNLIFIAAMGLAAWQGWDMGLTLSWTVPLTGVAQLAFTWVAARKLGYGFGIGWPRWTPELKHLAVIAGPAVLAGGVVQINLLVGRQVASFTEGAVAWLSYADRLYQLPLGRGGHRHRHGPFARAFPPPAGQGHRGRARGPEPRRRVRPDPDPARRRGADRDRGAAVPCPVSARRLRACRYPGHGAHALAIYGAGLPAFVLHKVLQPLFYAREDTRSPFLYALVSMVVNLVLAVGLLPLIGFSAAAWATTISGWAMVAQLWWGSRKMAEEARFDARFKARLPRIALAAALMGAVLYAAAWGLEAALSLHLWRFLALFALCLIGILAYFGAGLALGAFRLSDLRDLRRRPKA